MESTELLFFFFSTGLHLLTLQTILVSGDISFSCGLLTFNGKRSKQLQQWTAFIVSGIPLKRIRSWETLKLFFALVCHRMNPCTFCYFLKYLLRNWHFYFGVRSELGDAYNGHCCYLGIIYLCRSFSSAFSSSQLLSSSSSFERRWHITLTFHAH